MIQFGDNQKILFIGDSITDCGRDREDPSLLGNGYPQMVATRLNCDMPEMNFKFKNLGISGNRVKDLKERWSEDCLEYEPDVVSILIGINDVWRRFDSDDPTSAEEFLADYRTILTQLKEHGNPQIIILEPFVLPVPDDRKEWHIDLDPKIAGIRELAIEFADAYVPLDGLFAARSCRREAGFWANDGVHPTQAGHMVISDAWLEEAGVL